MLKYTQEDFRLQTGPAHAENTVAGKYATIIAPARAGLFSPDVAIFHVGRVPGMHARAPKKSLQKKDPSPY